MGKPRPASRKLQGPGSGRLLGQHIACQKSVPLERVHAPNGLKHVCWPTLAVMRKDGRLAGSDRALGHGDGGQWRPVPAYAAGNGQSASPLRVPTSRKTWPGAHRTACSPTCGRCGGGMCSRWSLLRLWSEASLFRRKRCVSRLITPASSARAVMWHGPPRWIGALLGYFLK